MRRFSKITTTQLARICGVSQGTVDRALHNRSGIHPETRERILAVAKEYDYIPNIEGSAQGNSMLIGVVLFDLYNEFFSKLAMSLVRTAREYGYSIIFQFSEKNDKNEYFDYIGVDGIVLFSVGSDSEEYENYLKSLKKPLVTIGNRLFDLPFIGIDDAQAMYDLSLELAKKISSGDLLYYAPILQKNLHSKNAQLLRKNGFVQAMNSLGRSYRIVTEQEELSNFGGIVCSTDHYMLNALNYLGYPNDLIIGGFDHISALKTLPVRVFSVEYSTDQIAKECFHYILGTPFTPKIEHRLVDNKA